ncbi:hypothetical protein [Parafannyhessea umbonata]|uniref:Uncharacterized protein n=1 Tax=Parafannyhessea umbonata TaxID=604330 RepID=A0A1H1L387_9ACTN|nr:hypothetical protein [Parafannyhessea umbonata]SDR68847.1 hypothetical protein SAMN04489857_0652 [Parafannyhessea umbonata]
MAGICGGALVVLVRTGKGIRQQTFKLSAIECQTAAKAIDALKYDYDGRPKRYRQIGEAESIDIWREVNSGVSFADIQESHGISPLQIESAVKRCECGRYGKLEP